MRFRCLAMHGLLFAGMQVLVPAGARAANFALGPTRLELGAKQQAAIITISNNSVHTLHLQVETMLWTMAVDGTWNLAPTDDLIVNPQLFEIAGTSNAALRVGTLQLADTTERAYRIIIEELPEENPSSEPGKPRVRMLTHVSVPVFVEPLKAQPVLSISAARIDGRQLVVNFNNSGNARVDPHQLAIRVLDNKRGEIFHNEQLLGYILPGSGLAVKLDMPAPACAQAKSLTLQLESLPALPEHDIGRGAGACDARSSH